MSAVPSQGAFRPSSETPEVASPWDRWGWAFASIWLVFLIYPIIESTQVDAPVGVQAFSIACCVAFGVTNILGYSVLADRPWLVLGAMVALMVATIPVIGVEAIGMTPYLGMMSALQIPAPWWKLTTTAAALLPLASLLSEDGFPLYFFLIAWPITLGGVLIRVFAEREREADAARASLALAAERGRVARDVHDVLGHSLTALSVKAELAARLIDVDPERARAELLSIQDTARQALAEVRTTVGGLRAANLEAELATAPRVLADAGVSTTVEGDVTETDPRHRTLLAWVLREAVTNVVRHASASSVTIGLSATGLVVSDDGRGTSGAEGNGLRGMRERVETAGGELLVTDRSPGTRLEVRLP